MRYNIHAIFCFLFFTCLSETTVFAREHATPVGASSLVFVENKGQITDQHNKLRHDVDFKLNAPGINVFIGHGQMHYQWVKVIDSTRSETYRLDVSLLGANTNAECVAENRQQYSEQYYLSQSGNGIRAGSCKKITYRNVYPNIDWILYLNGNELKYDFVVHKGGETKNIRLKYEGATKLLIDNGDLQIATPLGSLTEHRPYSYDAETKKKIESSYVLKDNILSFEVAANGREIVIDPQLAWATYYGGSGLEEFSLVGGPSVSGNYLCIDNLGFVYMANSTNSGNNIATSGTHKTVVSGVDGCIAKYNSAGNLIWGTYLGGVSSDVINGIVCGSDNSIYVAGLTDSKTGFSTPGSYQTAHGNGSAPGFDGMMAKLDANGQLIWSTYFGGAGEDWIRQITISSDDAIYITGYTSSKSNISSVGSHQSVNGNAFLAKFSTAGVRQWSTYYLDTANFGVTGMFNPQGIAVACDKNNNVYIAGIAINNKNVSTTNSHQPNHAGGADGYLAKFNPAGQLLWGTYYGGVNNDAVYDIACDDSSNVYIVGSTYSSGGISTQGAFLSGKPGATTIGDAFLTKFTSGGVRVWATYLQGYVGSVAVDRIGDVIIAGSGNTSSVFITTAGAWKSVPRLTDGTFIKFDSGGTRLWGTYFGGNKLDAFLSTAVDQSNNVYFSGTTSSDSLLSTVGSHQSGFGGNTDAFLMKAAADSIVYVGSVDTVICVGPNGADALVEYFVSRSFRTANTFTVQLSNAFGSFASPINIGSLTATASGFISCHIPAGTPVGNAYRIRVVSSAPAVISANNGKNIRLRSAPAKPVAIPQDTSVCEGVNLLLTATCATPGVGYQWSGPNVFTSQQSVFLNAVTTLQSGDYIVTVTPTNCRMSDTLHLDVIKKPKKPVIQHNSPICEQDTLVLQHSADTSIAVFTWYNPLDSADSAASIVIPRVTKAAQGTYRVVVDVKGCVNADTAEIFVKHKPSLKAGSNSPIREGNELQLFSETDSAGTTFYWTGPESYVSEEQNPKIGNVSKLRTGAYNVTATLNGCATTAQVLVIIDDNGKEDDYIELTPNPTRGSLRLRGLALTDQAIQIKVMNSMGQLIYNTIVGTVNRKLDTVITLPDVAAGNYYLEARISGKNKTLKFVISK